MLGLLVSTIGIGSWPQVSHSMGTRTANQCRERYYNFVKPDLNHSPITTEEAGMIIYMVGKIGRRWAHISRYLENRSESAVKNWWYGYARRQSAASLRAARVEPRRQESETIVQEATRQHLEITKAQSMHPQHPEDLRYIRNWLSDQARVDNYGPRAPDIRKSNHISKSTNVLIPSNRTLPPIPGFPVQKKLDQFRSELKASLWRTQKQSFRTSPIQHASTIKYPSSVQHTSPPYDKYAALLFGPPLLLVTPPSRAHVSMPAMCVISKSLKKDTPYRSTGDGVSPQYNPEFGSYHHTTAQQYILPQRYLRSQDEKYTALTGM
jgi:hypothetical protein